MSRPVLNAVVACLVCAAPVAGAEVGVTLVGRMNLPNSVFLTNVVIYEDDVNSRRYAILGDDFERVYIVDVTDPSDMRLASQIAGIPGFDVRTWDHYLYTCDGNTTGLDSRVIDLTDPAAPVVLPDGFASAHTLQISAAGFMYAEYPGLRIYDLANPVAPALVFETGGEGHDSNPKGTRLYDFHGRDGTTIYDVSNPAAPLPLGSITDSAIQFHHSGDVTDDERFLYICDELMIGTGADVSIWNIENPGAPVRVGNIMRTDATVHNFYVVGSYGYAAYYSAGLVVYDLTDPARPVAAGGYDTSKRSGDGFTGAIGAYVYSSDGLVYVCDVENGLFAFAVTPVVAAAAADAAFTLAQNAPNPFNPRTSIAFEIMRPGRASLEVYDVAGRRLRTLAARDFGAGVHTVEWDGRDDAGREAASGVYFYRMRAGDRTETRRMVLLK